jgi:hypothetical protein
MFDLGEAIVLLLKNYPSKDASEFDSRYGAEAPAVREKVHSILQEAMNVEPDWSRRTLNEAGDFVESVMHDRHPELSSRALESNGNYYTYLMR